jgi:hypothetical protein
MRALQSAFKNATLAIPFLLCFWVFFYLSLWESPPLHTGRPIIFGSFESLNPVVMWLWLKKLALVVGVASVIVTGGKGQCPEYSSYSKVCQVLASMHRND